MKLLVFQYLNEFYLTLKLNNYGVNSLVVNSLVFILVDVNSSVVNNDVIILLHVISTITPPPIVIPPIFNSFTSSINFCKESIYSLIDFDMLSCVIFLL